MKHTNPIQVWGSDVFSKIADIAAHQEDAFYVCDIGDIVAKHTNWQAKLPRVHPHYAVKCNAYPVVLETLAAVGAGFDCASKEEIRQILDLGVAPNRVIFALPAKPVSHILFAKALGVTKMTFDSEMELHKVKRVFPDAKLVLRFKYDDVLALCPLGDKFGCDPINDPPKLLEVARNLGLDVIGVSFHIGSLSHNPGVFRGAIKTASKICQQASEYGFQMRFLDLGGGYLGDHGSSLDETADVINKALGDFFPNPEIEVISEPGRYYVSSAFTLTANVHSIKVVDREEKHWMYYINAGIYNGFINKYFNLETYYPKFLQRKSTDQMYLSTIWGPTCDSFDKVAENILLPELSFGDWLIFENLGAYTLSISMEFNGIPVPKVYPIVDFKTWNFLKRLMPPEKFTFADNFKRGLLQEKISLDNKCERA